MQFYGRWARSDQLRSLFKIIVALFVRARGAHYFDVWVSFQHFVLAEI